MGPATGVCRHALTGHARSFPIPDYGTTDAGRYLLVVLTEAEDGRADDDTVARLADRVSRLEPFALRVVAADHDTDTMSDLLAALRASVEAARPKSARQRPG